MASSLVFTVQRREPVRVAPATPTPHEFKPLSDIDDQQGLHFHVSGIHFYRNNPSMAGRDPARVVREALAKALVFYHPLAGRLRERPGGKLVVECTGEGALFVEADADVRLEQFGAEPQPPFPCLEELIYGVEGSQAFLDSPLLTIQVTRLKCGGFIFAHRINHAMADALGTVQLVKAISEIARGADSPTVPPVWARELLTARDPPRVTHAHPEYDEVTPESTPAPAANMVVRSFFFGPREILALRRRLPSHLRKSTRFEVLTAFLWRSRTIALGADPDEELRLRFVLNARDKCSPPLPAGFYGNALAYPVAKSKAGELHRNPLAYAVELVRGAKASISDGYLQSAADLLVLRGRPHYTTARTSRVSDLTRLGFEEVDFGWGEAAYCGPAVGGGRIAPRGGSYYIRFRNGKGEDGILVPVSLPAPAMERFVMEIERMTTEPSFMKEENCSTPSSLILSPPLSSYLLTGDA